MPTMDVEAMVEKALLAIQGQTVSTPAGSGSESAFNRHLKTLFGQSRKEIEKTLQRAKDGNIHRKPLEKRFCKDCGEKGHYKGDTKCKSPSRHTLKMREKTRKKQDRDDEDQNEDEPKKGRFFRRGSRPNGA